MPISPIAQGSVTLRKMRNGSTASVVISSNRQLFQLYTVDAENNIHCAPDWSGSDYPSVSVQATSSSGSVQILGVVWKIDGVDATTIAGISQSTPNGKPTLHINTNLVDAAHRTSRMLTAQISIKDGDHISMIEKSEVIRIQQAVENGYVVRIDASQTYVNDTQNAVLTATCYNGLLPVTSGISYKWYDSSASTANELGNGGTTLTVTNAMVNGTQLIVLRGYDGSGNEVDSDAIIIADGSDDWFIEADVQQKQGSAPQGTQQKNVTSVSVASENDVTEVTFRVVKSDGTACPNTPTHWVVSKSHSDHLCYIVEVSGQQGHTKDSNTPQTGYSEFEVNNQATASINVYDKDYMSVGFGSEDLHQTEVIVTAQATLNPSNV